MTNWYPSDPALYEDVQTRWQYENVATKKSPEKRLERLWHGSRDSARTPVQWDAGKHAGFTDAEPWMPVNPNHTYINAESQVGDPDSIFTFYKNLIQLRKTHPVIVHGDFTLLMQEDAQVFAYTRSYEGKTLLVACNFSCEEAKLDEAARTRGEMLIANYKEDGDPGVLRAWECRVTLV